MGYSAYGAMTGVAALTAIATDPPDLIMLDVMLPELDGFEVCKRIKSNPATRHIPVVFLSGKNTPENIYHGKQIGGDHYFTKPFNSAMVMDAIKQLLKEEAVAPGKSMMLH